MNRERCVVVGVGGAGCNVVGRLVGRRFTGVRRIVADTDMKRLLHARIPERILLGDGVQVVQGAGGAPETGEWAARASKDTFLHKVGNAGTVVLVGGLGAGTGSGALPVLAGFLKEGKRDLHVVVTTPFRFEGPVRREQAEAALKAIRGMAIDLKVVPNEDPEGDKLSGTKDFMQAFRQRDGSVVEAVLAILGRGKR